MRSTAAGLDKTGEPNETQAKETKVTDMEFSALVLAPTFQPHTIYHWHESISSFLNHKVKIVESYEETVRSPSIELRIPAVIVLVKHIARNKSDVKFSRGNLYARDRYSCQYCGEPKEQRQLTYDHVVPRVQGGLTTWGNVVAACKKCNMRKGGRTPAQAGMRLLSKPLKPKTLPMTTMFALPREVPELWLPYLEGHATVAKSA